jgi:inhibitor of cysteine peptidase
MMTLDEQADGGRIELRKGAELALRLEENPSTGYRWQIDSAGAPALAPGPDRYEAPPGAKPGAPGHHVWSFCAVAPQTGVLKLSYRRSFGSAARTFTHTVDVR